MSDDARIVVGCVVQLSPDVNNPGFACCFMSVTEVETWGAQGFVQVIGTREAVGGHVYFRATWHEMEYIGIAQWMPEGTGE